MSLIINTSGGIFHNTTRLSQVPPTVKLYPLVNYDGLVGAWSFLWRNPDYHGPLVRLNNGIEEQDFRLIDLMLKFLSQGDGTKKLVGFYDQSGLSNDFMQSDAALQPLVDDSLAFSKFPIVHCPNDGTRYLINSKSNAVSDIFGVVFPTSTQSWGGLFQQSSSENYGIRVNPAGKYDTYNFTSSFYINSVNTRNFSYHLWHVMGARRGSTVTMSGNCLFTNGAYKTSRRWFGKAAEFLMYNSVLSVSDHLAICDDLKTTYKI